MQDFHDPWQTGPAKPLPRRRSNLIWWILGGVGGLVVLGCGGIIAVVVYLGDSIPETSIYTGNQVPAEFTRVMKDAGALQEGEKILYFYSDGMMDIRDGFYFVSDRRVVIYSRLTGISPLTSIPFDEIIDLDLYRNESFFDDSQITLHLDNGEILSFPVSSEYDRDQDFFDAIRDRADNVSK